MAEHVVIVAGNMRHLPGKVKCLREFGGRHAVCSLPDGAGPG